MKIFAMLIASVMSFGVLVTDAETTTSKAEAKQEAQKKVEKIAKKLQARRAEMADTSRKVKEHKEEVKK